MMGQAIAATVILLLPGIIPGIVRCVTTLQPVGLLISTIQ
jgi:hypothetical protein